MVTEWARRRHGRRVFERAVRYAANGWPVAPLAVPRHGVCPCDLGDCVEPHLVGEPISNGFVAAGVWTAYPWDIALVTAAYDVVDLPPQYGASLHRALKTTCPTAMAPTRRRWWFFVAAGSVSASGLAPAGGVLRTGPEGWVPAPGTYTERTGRVRWLVDPHLTNWRPYRPRDPLNQLLDKTSVD